MNLLFTMSLAGVIPLVPYYFLKATGICTGIQLRRLLKLSIFFFLCPIQVLKYIFPFKFPAFMYQLSNKIYLKREGYTIIKMYDGSYYPVPNWMLIIAIVWTATVICIATIYSLKYRKFKTLLLEKSNPVPEKQIDITIYSNHSAHIHCNISTLIRTPFVIGILTPEIFLPDTKLTEEELSMVLLHETAHVRYKDLLYKSLCFVICLIHWFNPFAWLLLQEYADVSEIVCDECVIHTYTTKEQRKRYATLIVNLTVRDQKMQNIFLNSFSRDKGKRKMITRIEAIMNFHIKKAGFAMASFIISIIMSTCTITAYALPPSGNSNLLQSITEGEYIADCSITKQYDFSNTDTIFISGSEESSHNNELMKNSVIEEQYNFSVFNEIFIEESGKQRAVLSGNEQRKALCRHSFISGFIVRHIKNHKGGCTVKKYSADICTKCKYSRLGKLLSETKYNKCPH